MVVMLARVRQAGLSTRGSLGCSFMALTNPARHSSLGLGPRFKKVLNKIILSLQLGNTFERYMFC